ncbi:MAG: response regulator transcription factor [Ktedonobacterales bacterium]
MEIKTTVLVVDDDPAIVDLLRDFLEMEGYSVATAVNGEEALQLVEQESVGCMLLDVMMPAMSGFDLCRRIRETRDVPILFLSGRDTDADKIRGLANGGDDYIVKSATPSEVVMRVKAVLRRTRRELDAQPATLLNFGRLVIDARAREVRLDGDVVPFAAREFDVLQLLAEHPRQVFTHEQIFEHLWGDYGDRHTVAVHVNRIRQKVEEDPANPRYIVTVWGVGYRFEGVRR